MVVALDTALFDREIRRDTFELLAIRKGQHFELRISRKFVERLHLRLGLGKIRAIERRERNQTHVHILDQCLHLLACHLHKQEWQHDGMVVLHPVFFGLYAYMIHLLRDVFDIHRSKRLDRRQQIAHDKVVRNFCRTV